MTALELIDLMPIVAHRNFAYVNNHGLRDEKGFCPICALVDELIGWDGDRSDAWWALSWLTETKHLSDTEHKEVGLFVHWADARCLPHNSGYTKLRLVLGLQP